MLPRSVVHHLFITKVSINASKLSRCGTCRNCEVSKKQVSGKIALVNGYVGYDLYKVLIESKAVGFISFSGEMRDSDDITDLDQRELRNQLATLGVIPGVHMKVKDASDLVE